MSYSFSINHKVPPLSQKGLLEPFNILSLDIEHSNFVAIALKLFGFLSLPRLVVQYIALLLRISLLFKVLLSYTSPELFSSCFIGDPTFILFARLVYSNKFIISNSLLFVTQSFYFDPTLFYLWGKFILISVGSPIKKSGHYE